MIAPPDLITAHPHVKNCTHFTLAPTYPARRAREPAENFERRKQCHNQTQWSKCCTVESITHTGDEITAVWMNHRTLLLANEEVAQLFSTFLFTPVTTFNPAEEYMIATGACGQD